MIVWGIDLTRLNSQDDGEDVKLRRCTAGCQVVEVLGRMSSGGGAWEDVKSRRCLGGCQVVEVLGQDVKSLRCGAHLGQGTSKYVKKGFWSVTAGFRVWSVKVLRKRVSEPHRAQKKGSATPDHPRVLRHTT